jgi:hypothetical protein
MASAGVVSTVWSARGGAGAVPGGPGRATRRWPAGGPRPAGTPDGGGLVVLRGLVEHVLDVLSGDCCAYR